MAAPSHDRRTLLVVDDDPVLGAAVRDGLSSPSLAVELAGTGAEAIGITRAKRVDVVLLDQKLPDTNGQALCRPILEAGERTQIIFITAYPSFSNVLQALREGACDYLSKPFELEAVRHAVDRALRISELEKLEKISRYRARRETRSIQLVGLDGGLAGLHRLIELACRSDLPVLITGETGTGKSLVARAIHYRSAADPNCFVTVNCAALPESLIENELFGHDQGAFTGATSSRPGIFEMADGGTLFLDEIGTMPLDLQAKLLGVLDDRRVRRIGGRRSRRVDVRILAATNETVEEAVAGGRFREDLYYRLSVLRIEVPPLRDRLSDLPDLCQSLLRQVSASHRFVLPEAELAALARYRWPGNVRELRNVLERAVLVAENGTLRPSAMLNPSNPRRPSTEPGPPSRLPTLREQEEALIRQALELHDGVKARAARALGISLSTLKRRVNEFRLDRAAGSI